MAAAAAILLVSWRMGALSILGDPERLRASLLEMGPAGYVVYLVAFAILQPLGLPGVGFVAGASYVWPKPVAFGLSLVGSLLSCTVGFGFSRFVARDWIEARLPERLRGYDERIAKSAFGTAIVVRLVFWLNPFSHAVFGVSKARYAPYIAGSTVGLVPTLFALVWASGQAIEYLRATPVGEWLPFALALVGGLVLIKLYRLWARRRQDKGTVEKSSAL